MNFKISGCVEFRCWFFSLSRFLLTWSWSVVPDIVNILRMCVCAFQKFASGWLFDSKIKIRREEECKFSGKHNVKRKSHLADLKGDSWRWWRWREKKRHWRTSTHLKRNKSSSRQFVVWSIKISLCICQNLWFVLVVCWSEMIQVYPSLLEGAARFDAWMMVWETCFIDDFFEANKLPDCNRIHMHFLSLTCIYSFTRNIVAIWNLLSVQPLLSTVFGELVMP